MESHDYDFPFYLRPAQQENVKGQLAGKIELLTIEFKDYVDNDDTVKTRVCYSAQNMADLTKASLLIGFAVGEAIKYHRKF